MCGIAGFATTRAEGVPGGALEQSLRLLKHRGPDDHGFLSVSGDGLYCGRETERSLTNASLLMTHRRLSILDLSDAGTQPMASRHGNRFIVFNGEIYNHVELRSELERLGHRFRSNCDTEVLLAAYDEWGEDVLPRLVGMFAFAIYDRDRNDLFLARDPFGIKPLFYAITPGGFSFASEIKVLLNCLDLPRSANPGRLFRYLRYGLTDYGDQTLFGSVKQLDAGCSMRVDLTTAEVEEQRRYWRLDTGETIDVSFEEAASTVRELFLKNVALHMRADVPLGAALSGGIDSSSIVMAMRELGGSRLDLNLYSFIASSPRLSEEKWIDLVARRSGGRLNKLRLESGDVASQMTTITRIHDEPLGSASVVAQNAIFRNASEDGVKVMLDGQGADEILGGYKLYLGARMASMVRKGQWARAARFAANGRRQLGMPVRMLLALTADHLTPNAVQGPARRLVGHEAAPSWLNKAWFSARGIHLSGMNYVVESDALRARMARSVETSLPHLLRYEDRNSMAHSVESRVPFLTPELVGYLARLPESYIVSDTGESKSVFREAMRGMVPDAILDRRDKIGFETAEGSHLKRLGPWLERLLSRDTIDRIPALRAGEIRSHWRQVAEGKRAISEHFWRWINLIDWSDQYDVQYT